MLPCRVSPLLATVLALNAFALASPAQACLGDCNGDREVTVDEVTTGIQRALGEDTAPRCAAFDPDSDGRVDVADVITAVTNLLHGCPADPLELAAAKLEENRAKWEAAGIDSYDLDYRRSCFCPPPGDVQVLVRGGEIFSIRDPDTGAEIENPSTGAFGFNSVDGLFDAIAAAINGRVARLDVEYDPELGYPTSISIDFIADAVDDEIGIRINGLHVAG